MSKQIFWGVRLPSTENKMLEFAESQKSDKISFIIYVDCKSLIKRIDGRKNNSEKSSTTKVGEHIPCWYSKSAIWIFDGIENNHDVYGDEDCMKKVRESLRAHAIKITSFGKKKTTPFREQQHELYEKTKICFICKNKFEHKYANGKGVL